jgi:transcriptional regulator with XRE-family HTH domain
MKENTNKNAIVLYRRRMGFSQKQVARIVGQRDATRISHYEHGDMLPTLRDALALGIVLRVPLEFLFPALYKSLRETLRGREEEIARGSKSSGGEGT